MTLHEVTQSEAWRRGVGDMQTVLCLDLYAPLTYVYVAEGMCIVNRIDSDFDRLMVIPLEWLEQRLSWKFFT